MSIGTDLRSLLDVRLADPDKEPVREWCIINSKRNSFDDSVLAYPATKVLAAHSNGYVLGYMPIQGTAMLESFGPNPNATPIQQANTIKELAQGACLMAHAAGYREVFFAVSDELTAEGAKLLGFEKYPFMLYRKKL